MKIINFVHEVFVNPDWQNLTVQNRIYRTREIIGDSTSACWGGGGKKKGNRFSTSVHILLISSSFIK